jgi:excisionase family DNA binding protein
VTKLNIDRFTSIDDLPELLTPEEFMAVTGSGRSQTYDLIRSGKIPSVSFGRLKRIPKQVLTLPEVRP